MTTHQAFKTLINIQFIHRDIGVSATHVRQIRKKVNDNPTDPKKWNTTLDLMHDWLTRAGYTKTQETIWKG